MNTLRFCAGLITIALALLPARGQAEVKDATSTGFTVENSAVVPADATVAWQALVNHVDAWWPKDHTWWGEASTLTIDAHAGGCFCERGKKAEAQHLQVVFVDPPKLLRMLGGLGPLQGMGLSGVLEWRMAAVEGGTKITLWYRAGGYSPDDIGKFATAVDRVQALQLGALATYVRDHAGKPKL